MILLDIDDFEVSGPDIQGAYTVFFGKGPEKMTMYFYPQQFKSKHIMDAKDIVADMIQRIMEINREEVAIKLLGKMPNLLQDNNEND